MVGPYGRKLNPGSKPRYVGPGSGQKWIPVLVPAGNWIRGQNPDMLVQVPVKNGFRPVLVPVENWIRGQNPDLLSTVPVKNWFRYTRSWSEIESGVRIPICYLGLPLKIDSGIPGSDRKLISG